MRQAEAARDIVDEGDEAEAAPIQAAGAAEEIPALAFPVEDPDAVHDMIDAVDRDGPAADVPVAEPADLLGVAARHHEVGVRDVGDDVEDHVGDRGELGEGQLACCCS
jgi:hypothetical protein